MIICPNKIPFVETKSFNNTCSEEKIKIVKSNINDINFDMFLSKINKFINILIVDKDFY